MGILSATDEKRMIRSRNRSASQCCGSADPDPYQNVTDAQHWCLHIDATVLANVMQHCWDKTNRFTLRFTIRGSYTHEDLNNRNIFRPISSGETAPLTCNCAGTHLRPSDSMSKSEMSPYPTLLTKRGTVLTYTP